MRRMIRVGICAIAVGAIVGISVAGAGSKTIRATPAAARTATAPRLGPLAHSGVACPIATSSPSVCSATPCTVYIQSAAGQTAVFSSRAPATLRGRLHVLARQLAGGQIAPKRIITAPAVRRALAPRNPRCVAKANSVPRAIPISAPVGGETVTRTAGR
jgi:hypothetical protein